MEATQNNNRRLTPYKILTMVLYGSYDFVSWSGERVTLKNGPFSDFFGLHPHRLKNYLNWLEEMTFIKNLSREWGTTSFEVVIPPRLAELGITVGSLKDSGEDEDEV